MQQQLQKPYKEDRRTSYQKNEQPTPGDLALDVLEEYLEHKC